MSTGLKCRNCNSNEIEEDNARGDRVCMNCGSVLEDSLIVSEVQFEEVGHGAAAIGQFVSAESSGGATNYGYGKFQVGSGTESREVTIKKAKKDITLLCQQLQLTQHYADTALNFFKMALSRHLTRGRKSTHIYAACVYMTCRTEGTSHLLIDISDVQQICSYELGRTYLKLSHALCINIPSVDPCLYIMRFANRLQLGAKTHEVSMTALRIVQRMKKDCMHSGRRPTGLCGAALLIAARMHEFSRTLADVIGVVKIHESTLRKRLSEFAETPSGGLTLEEFMTVDLEREQDPPSFKAARIKDRELIQNMGIHELTELQKQIDAHLEKDLGKYTGNIMRQLTKSKGKKEEKDNVTDNELEIEDSMQFIEQSNAKVIKEFIANNTDDTKPQVGMTAVIEGLRPDIEAICRVTQHDLEDLERAKQPIETELFIDDLNDEELDQYVLTEQEAVTKSDMWKNLNAEYLREQQEREERLAKEREEGKPEKKKRKQRKKVIGPSSSAGEAIEKMLQEKKISSKINYDILKTLTEGMVTLSEEAETSSEQAKPKTEKLERASVILEESPIAGNSRSKSTYDIPPGPSRKRPKVEAALSVSLIEQEIEEKPAVAVDADDIDYDVEPDDVDADAEPETEATLQDMLNKGAADEDDDEYGYGFEEEEY
ncbi:transcription factor IIIB 90 kDa subunit [Drosophila sulfurigaster albostrigata]|uniref:transcription factor IIIB 90 kDa subunit n=1 Tax=Drosophila sulfurigaster albostrigata TaxID=89887 RepID=UPI002D218411|nr:transcription factor IIIB 90 kDa subunit [Drosophila sulfurigaster albostrigata]